MAASVATYEKIIEHEGKVQRQSITNRLIHWSVAISIFILFISGFGQMPIFKRYGMADLPGMAWTANYAVTLALHYIASGVLLFAAAFHVVFHGARKELGLLPRRGDVGESVQIIKAMITRGEEPASDKYLAEQRLAYAFIGANVVVLVISGFFKFLDNLPSVGLSDGVGWMMTTLHNVSMLLLLFGIIGHLAAFVVPANRRLLTAMFHGKVDLTYVEHRHCLWCDRLRALHHQSAQPRETDPVGFDNISQFPQTSNTQVDAGDRNELILSAKEASTIKE